ncbi:hypothetical protein L3X38_033079 [Prunus dulcis]|uniref:Uncharacterized protein n=1 Tax=Prunus dulcis TaxID=3755 RepID=A0AAD4YWH2_PRUDU|nr:hypothetical protein L3X38_033079 [Prunus dulcis]
MLLIFSSSTLLAPFCASKIQIAKTQKPSFLIPHHSELMHNSPLEKAPAHKKPKAYNSWSPTLEAVSSESSASLNFVVLHLGFIYLMWISLFYFLLNF